MKKALFAATLIAAACAAPAMAQTSNFTGLNASARLNFASASVDLPGAGFDAGGASRNFGVQGAYVFDLGNRYTLGVGVSSEIGEVKFGRVSSTISFVGNNISNVFLAPGYLLNNSSLAYAKLAYSSIDIEEKFTGGSRIHTHSGFGIGFGLRTTISGNWSMDVEFLQTAYDAQRYTGITGDIKPASTSAGVGLNYRF